MLQSLQSLRVMREISPDYLAQFASYLDALQWLEQADVTPKGPAREAAPRRKRVPKRGGSRP